MNIQMISERTSRKVAFLASVAFMVLAWLFAAALFVVIVVDLPDGLRRRWGTVDLTFLGISVSLLAAIPIQIGRYFKTRHSKGTSHGKTREGRDWIRQEAID